MQDYLDDLKYDVAGDNYEATIEYHDHQEYEVKDYTHDNDYPESDYGTL